jgi:hypothetical protein
MFHPVVTMIDISSIEFHDVRILRVSEETDTDTLIMDVDYPVDWFESKYQKRRLIFTDAFNYQVHEQPFTGCPTILEAKIATLDNGWTQLRLETNAGFREVSCKDVRLVEPDSANSSHQSQA